MHISIHGLGYFMKKYTLLLFLFCAYSLSSQNNTLPFKSGEKLVYSAHYHWGFLWVEAGEVSFQFDIGKKESSQILKMQSIGKTLPKYDWLFKVRDTFGSEAVFPGMYPLKSKRINYEGKSWVFNYHTFLKSSNRIISDYADRDTNRRIDTIPYAEERILDVQTAVYYARLWDLSNAKIGDINTINLVIGNKIYPIQMVFQGEDIVKHINGKVYPCYKITTKVVEGLIFRANQEISLFVSKNKSQIPIVVRAPILFGKVEAYLKQSFNADFVL